MGGGCATLRGRGSAWTLAACLVFALASTDQYRQVLRDGFGTSIAVPRLLPEPADAPRERADHLWPPRLEERRTQWEETDHAFAVWVVSRNAHTLLGAPGELFGEGPCFPFPRPLALGHPALTQGLLAAPPYALTRNPIAAYNAVMLAGSFLAALAAFALVRGWTASPAAGIAAGLLVGFHGARTSLATYPFIVDLAWTLFAMHFGERYFARGRARDAAAAAACVALQLWMSLYASLICALVLLPHLVWLLARYGTARLRRGPVAAALLWIGVPTALLALPYLGLPGAPGERVRYLAQWSAFLPGRFLGWLVLLLALLPFAPGPRQEWASRRFALLAAAALLLWLATGGSGAFDFLPGFDLVRGPFVLAIGIHLALSLLAGLGAARLLRLVPERGRLAAAGLLLAVVFADTLHPELVGARAPVSFRALPLAAAEVAARGLFRQLAELGDLGPVAEIPSGPPFALRREASRTLIQAYHHRPTSACYNSVIPVQTQRVRQLTREIPDREALRELRALGFTTLVVHGGAEIQERMRAAAAANGGLRELRANAAASAWSLAP
jgi:hypothetical protein